MQVILIKDVDHLGGKNELVTVKNGYARNYLIPQKFAIEASSSNVKQLAERQKVQAKNDAALLAKINDVIAVLKGESVKIGAKTGTSGKIFGSVTTLQLSRAIQAQKGFDIDRKKITILDDVKELGTYKANIDFGNGKTVEIDFEVIGE